MLCCKLTEAPCFVLLVKFLNLGNISLSSTVNGGTKLVSVAIGFC